MYSDDQTSDEIYPYAPSVSPSSKIKESILELIKSDLKSIALWYNVKEDLVTFKSNKRLERVKNFGSIMKKQVVLLHQLIFLLHKICFTSDKKDQESSNFIQLLKHIKVYKKDQENSKQLEISMIKKLTLELIKSKLEEIATKHNVEEEITAFEYNKKSGRLD